MKLKPEIEKALGVIQESLDDLGWDDDLAALALLREEVERLSGLEITCWFCGAKLGVEEEK